MLDRLGVALRPESDDDRDFVRRLYHDGRADEVAAAGWPDAMAARFLDEQFRLQSAHYDSHHPDAERVIVTAGARGGAVEPIGRRYVDRRGPTWRLLEIGLLAAWRGRGIGAALVGALQREAADAGAAALSLSVLHGNVRAAALYARLGFVEAASLVPSHRAMVWRPPTLS